MQATAAPNLNELPGVDANVRERLIDQLNQDLATLTDLAAAYKQAHWNVIGKDFSQLHKLFDELYEQALEYIDLVAERAVALGGVAHGTLQAAVEHTSLAPFPLAERDEIRLLEELGSRLDRTVSEIRRGIGASDDELATQDIYLEIARGLEKQRWFLLAHLAGPEVAGRTRPRDRAMR